MIDFAKPRRRRGPKAPAKRPATEPVPAAIARPPGPPREPTRSYSTYSPDCDECTSASFAVPLRRISSTQDLADFIRGSGPDDYEYYRQIKEKAREAEQQAGLRGIRDKFLVKILRAGAGTPTGGSRPHAVLRRGASKKKEPLRITPIKQVASFQKTSDGKAYYAIEVDYARSKSSTRQPNMELTRRDKEALVAARPSGMSSSVSSPRLDKLATSNLTSYTLKRSDTVGALPAHRRSSSVQVSPTASPRSRRPLPGELAAAASRASSAHATDDGQPETSSVHDAKLANQDLTEIITDMIRSSTHSQATPTDGPATRDTWTQTSQASSPSLAGVAPTLTRSSSDRSSLYGHEEKKPRTTSPLQGTKLSYIPPRMVSHTKSVSESHGTGRSRSLNDKNYQDHALPPLPGPTYIRSEAASSTNSLTTSFKRSSNTSSVERIEEEAASPASPTDSTTPHVLRTRASTLDVIQSIDVLDVLPKKRSAASVGRQSLAEAIAAGGEREDMHAGLAVGTVEVERVHTIETTEPAEADDAMDDIDEDTVGLAQSEPEDDSDGEDSELRTVPDEPARPAPRHHRAPSSPKSCCSECCKHTHSHNHRHSRTGSYPYAFDRFTLPLSLKLSYGVPSPTASMHEMRRQSHEADERTHSRSISTQTELAYSVASDRDVPPVPASAPTSPTTARPVEPSPSIESFVSRAESASSPAASAATSPASSSTSVPATVTGKPAADDDYLVQKVRELEQKNWILQKALLLVLQSDARVDLSTIPGLSA
ncbi:uncharacterized protein V1510DRAFT_424241 [Dipodascopsis tothii]|uniref:uncharacterized protein n=1 Tax=Dipodascopsis tothii TaxID=44089 RepID=UPI0034CE19C5